MRHVMLVGIGGFIGAVLRYKLSGLILHFGPNWKFPAATFVVNVVGCMVAGVLMGVIIKHESISLDAQRLLITGILGGFTTFSAFGVETVTLLERRETLMAFLYVFSTVTVALSGMWLTMRFFKS